MGARMNEYKHNMRVRFDNDHVGVLKRAENGFMVHYEFEGHLVAGGMVFTPEDLAKHGAVPCGKVPKREVSDAQADALAKGRATLAQKRADGTVRVPVRRRKGDEMKKGKRPVGRTTGLSIQRAWVHIFETNAKARKVDRMTDEQISEFMCAEFPGHAEQSKVFHKVQVVRTRYNRGGMTKGTVPDVLSVQYDDEGERVAVRRGRPRSPKKKTRARARVRRR